VRDYLLALAENDSPAFLVVLIALAAGLRKGEIVVELLRGFRARAAGAFVIEGGGQLIRPSNVGTRLPGAKCHYAYGKGQ
jgi:hypothetical protein